MARKELSQKKKKNRLWYHNFCFSTLITTPISCLDKNHSLPKPVALGLVLSIIALLLGLFNKERLANEMSAVTRVMIILIKQKISLEYIQLLTTISIFKKNYDIIKQNYRYKRIN